MKAAIQVDGLRKRYGSQTVLNGLQFEVLQGEIFALLGVNGAGKTTALECVEGLRKYDGGHIAVQGRMGIQLQSASLPAHIKPMEAVRLFAKWNRAHVDPAMLDALGIDGLANQPYGQLSTGQKRRLHLALALIGDPDVIFLDEPTAGLDVEARVALHRLLGDLRAQGKTLCLASHDMAEVEGLCDHIAILRHGQIVFSGTVDALTEKVGSRYTVFLQTTQGDEQFETDSIGDALLALLEDYKRRNIAVQDIRIDRGTLEQHFLDIARGDEA